MKTGFKNPYVIFEDKRVYVPDANKATVYSCPQCNGSMKLRGGERISDHFYHLNSVTGCESHEHLASKEIISYAVNAGEDIAFAFLCDTHSYVFRESYYIHKRVPSGRFLVEQEIRLGPYVVDLLFRDRATHVPRFAVEILKTSRISGIKATYLPVPFIEVKATSVLQNYYTIPVSRSSISFRCPQCASFIADRERWRRRSEERLGSPVSDPAYHKYQEAFRMQVGGLR